MTFAVIGASSFSGRSFCDHLRRRGITAIRLSRPAFDLNVDRAMDALAEIVEQNGVEYVVNFAALNVVEASWQHALDYYRTNVVGIARLAERLRLCGCLKKFVQVSTPEVYGSTLVALAEESHFRPSTPYAVSRAAADMHLAACHAAYGLPVCFTRTVNVYGAGQQLYRIVPKTILAIMEGRRLPLHGDGNSERSFLHIDDVADGIYRVAIDGVPGRAYHMAAASMAPIRDLVRLICERMGAEFDRVTESAPERVGKDPAYWLDDRRIRRDLGWIDTVPLETGIDGVIAWLRENSASLAAQPREYGHRP